MAAAYLTAKELGELLEELAARLYARGTTGTLLIVGDAAMSLGHGGRRVTRDVDGDFQPRQPIQAVAVEMARERGLRENWLNSAAAAFLPHLQPEDRVVLHAYPGLTVQLASPRVLLAMKLAAFRGTDIPDLVTLFQELDVTDADEAVRITRELYGEHAELIRDNGDVDLRLRAEDVLERIELDRTS